MTLNILQLMFEQLLKILSNQLAMCVVYFLRTFLPHSVIESAMHTLDDFPLN